MKADFWPCLPVHDDDGRLSSVIFTEFHRLDRTYPKYSSTGYSVERLVKQLARGQDPGLLKRVRFDPEADMFAAYGDDPDALLEIATLIRKATGQKRPPASKIQATLTPDQAREALRRGYVASLDAAAQKQLLRGWPRRPDPAYERLEREIRARAQKTRLLAARRIVRMACRCIGHQPLAHPKSFDAVMAALAAERDPKVHDELAFALSMMCNRAYPDLRATPQLEAMLANPRWRVRWAGVDGLGALCVKDWSKLITLFDDPHDKVRAAVCRAAWEGEGTVNSWAIGDPELVYASRFPRDQLAKLEAKLQDKACKQFASNALAMISNRGRRDRTRGSG